MSFTDRDLDLGDLGGHVYWETPLDFFQVRWDGGAATLTCGVLAIAYQAGIFLSACHRAKIRAKAMVSDDRNPQIGLLVVLLDMPSYDPSTRLDPQTLKPIINLNRGVEWSPRYHNKNRKLLETLHSHVRSMHCSCAKPTSLVPARALLLGCFRSLSTMGCCVLTNLILNAVMLTFAVIGGLLVFTEHWADVEFGPQSFSFLVGVRGRMDLWEVQVGINPDTLVGRVTDTALPFGNGGSDGSGGNGNGGGSGSGSGLPVLGGSRRLQQETIAYDSEYMCGGDMIYMLAKGEAGPAVGIEFQEVRDQVNKNCRNSVRRSS